MGQSTDERFAAEALPGAYRARGKQFDRPGGAM
jgi:hypothetical protein